MFEGISAGLGNALSFFRSRGKLTEANIGEGLQAVKQALLEADVHYDVATNFVKKVGEEAIGQQVFKTLDPTRQIIGIVHQELVDLMGPVDHSLHLRRGEVTVLMMCGLQGSGKTTTCGKLARMLLESGRKPMLVAADLQRPAAVDQLKIIGEQLGVPVYSEPQPTNAVRVCQNGVAQAKKAGDISVVILDTAGRLHVDRELMQELEQVDRKVSPHQVFLVCDAMTGQDAVNSAKAFNDALELDGVILTKLDGDSRGGAALSVKEVTGVPIKFIGVGEQLDKLEPFHPDRMAGRILGMGDVVTLFEKAQKEFDADQVAEQQKRMAQGKFGFNDFLSSMQMIKRLGPLRSVMQMIPGMDKLVGIPDFDAEGDMKRMEGIIRSMTPAERDNPDLIDRSRRNRIAVGSGVEPAEVNKLVKEFTTMASMMKNVAGLGQMDKMRAMSQLTNSLASNPQAALLAQKQRSKRGPQDRNEAAEKKKKARKEAAKQKKRNRK